MSEPVSQDEKTKGVSSASKTSSRTASGSGRSGGVANAKAPDGSAPAKGPVPRPSTGKLIAVIACFVLFLACIGVSIYIVFFKPAKQPRVVIHELSPEAQKLVDDAEKAEQLYAESKEKSKSSVLEDLEEADTKLTQAVEIWEQISKINMTVKGYEEKISYFQKTLPKIDQELRDLRTKKYDAESARRLENMKKQQAAPPSPQPAPAVAPPANGSKGDDLSDANISRLLKDDPSEAERIIKLRQKQEPAYKPPEEP